MKKLKRGGITKGEGKPTVLTGVEGCIIPLNDRGMKILSAALAKAMRDMRDKP